MESPKGQKGEVAVPSGRIPGAMLVLPGSGKTCLLNIIGATRSKTLRTMTRANRTRVRLPEDVDDHVTFRRWRTLPVFVQRKCVELRL